MEQSLSNIYLKLFLLSEFLNRSILYHRRTMTIKLGIMSLVITLLKYILVETEIHAFEL